MADLSGVDLHGAYLVEANLHQANLRNANLEEADLMGANLHEANLDDANLHKARLREASLRHAMLQGSNLSQAILIEGHCYRTNFRGANLSGANLFQAALWNANLNGANLSRAHLGQANLTGANLTGANLSGAGLGCPVLVDTDLTGADLTGCRIYGISAWNVALSGAKQQNLVITEKEPEITVDNVEIAQFIYLMLHNQKVRDVIDAITSKEVLILGRFTDERKAVLDALRDELRRRNYLPILFDFEPSASRSTVETITLLARMARFVIAEEPGMFDFFRHYDRWFLPVHRYDTPGQLLSELSTQVIEPLEAKVSEIRAKSA